MPNVGDKHDCTYPGCKAKMVLTERRMAASSKPKAVRAGAPFPATDRFRSLVLRDEPAPPPGGPDLGNAAGQGLLGPRVQRGYGAFG